MPEVVKLEDIKDVSDFRHRGLPKPAIEIEPTNLFERVRRRFYDAVDKPVTWLKESVIEPIQAKNKHVYYHRRFPRVPTIDECTEGDLVCYYEANSQFKRDRIIDDEILMILRQRKNHCYVYERDDWAKNCRKELEDYQEALTNHFLRYGEIGYFGNAVNAYMRQKHRMIWERRNPDKVDFMYAKERMENGYIVPVEKGTFDSPQLPDNSRNRYVRQKEL